MSYTTKLFEMNIPIRKPKKVSSTLILSIIFVFLTIFFGIFFVLTLNTQNKIDSNQKDVASNLNIKENTSTPSPTPKETPTPYSEYYVPVTGFKELKNNISLTELQTKDIRVLSSEKTSLTQAFSTYKFTELDDNKFVDEIANSNEIGLISWRNLNPRLKVLSIDSQYFFDRSIDLEKYPLKITTQIASNTKMQAPFDKTKLHNILGAGEIIPARTVDKVMRTKNDYLWPFRSVKDFMAKYDARVATFESALLGSGNGNVCALNCFTFIGNEKFIEGMKYSGINLVSLANNHSMAAGTEGIANTIKLLNDANIKTIGASPTNNDDATKPDIIQIGNTKYGFIAYNDIPSVNDWATDTKGGTARIDTNEYKIIPGQVKKDVERAKALGAQYIIAIIHWGAREYTNDPLDHQKELAHNMIDNGVDLILGDHPHWTMSVEFYKSPNSDQPKFIYYGIGNFVFDQDWSIETSQGSFAELNFYEDKLLSIKFHPHQIYQTQPRLLTENEPQYKQIFDRIWQFTGKI